MTRRRSRALAASFVVTTQLGHVSQLGCATQPPTANPPAATIEIGPTTATPSASASASAAPLASNPPPVLRYPVANPPAPSEKK